MRLLFYVKQDGQDIDFLLYIFIINCKIITRVKEIRYTQGIRLTDYIKNDIFILMMQFKKVGIKIFLTM